MSITEYTAEKKLIYSYEQSGLHVNSEVGLSFDNLHLPVHLKRPYNASRRKTTADVFVTSIAICTGEKPVQCNKLKIRISKKHSFFPTTQKAYKSFNKFESCCAMILVDSAGGFLVPEK